MPKIKTPHGTFWVADQRKDQDATPSIIVHGAGGSHLSFPKPFRQSPIITPVLIDLNGHGLSTGEGHDTIADHAEDMVAIMDTMEISEANLMGHSMGGAVAQWLALHYPTRVAKLVLIGTGGKFEVNPLLINGIVDNTEDTIALLNKWMWAKSVPDTFREMSADMLSKIDPYIIQRDYIVANKFDVLHRLKDITQPVLVIAGENDQMAHPALSQQLVDKLPDATLVTIKDAGHMMHLEQPDHVTKLIEDWLQQEN